MLWAILRTTVSRYNVEIGIDQDRDIGRAGDLMGPGLVWGDSIAQATNSRTSRVSGTNVRVCSPG
jgi:hypothetical protein